MAKQDVVIRQAAVRLADAEAIEALLQRLPPGISENLRLELEHRGAGFSGMRYDSQSRRGFWFAADEHHLLCVTLPSLTEEEAARIWDQIDRHQCGGNVAEIAKAYDAVTGLKSQTTTRI
jgi:hypothetical protein